MGGYRKGKAKRGRSAIHASVFSCLVLLLLGLGVQERRLKRFSVSPAIFGWTPTADANADETAERRSVDTTGVSLHDSRGDASVFMRTILCSTSGR